MPERRSIVLWTTAALVVLAPWIAESTGHGYLVTVGARILIYALAALSLDLIVGYAGMVSLGHAAFFGTGAYIAGMLAWHRQEGSGLFWLFEWTGSASVLVTLPAAMAVSAVLAALIGVLSLRTQGVYFIMITLAFAQMVFFFFTSLAAYGGGDGLVLWSRNTLPGVDLDNNTTFYFLCLAVLATAILLVRRLVDARFGMVLRGCRQNEQRMRALGFATTRYKLVAFTLSGALAGLAGALMTNLITFVSPGQLHWTVSGELLVILILGGLGTVYGPLFGAIALLALEEILPPLLGQVSEPLGHGWRIALGPILLLVVLFARRGVFGLLAGPGAARG